MSDCLAVPEGHQPGQQLPHTHWLYWAKLPAEDFPAAPIASLLQQEQQRKQEPGRQQPPPRDVLPGACCITTLLRSLVQQLSDAVPGAFQGTAGGATGQGRAPEQQAALQAAVVRIEQSVQPQHAAWVRQLLAEVCHADWRQHQQTYLSVVSGVRDAVLSLAVYKLLLLLFPCCIVSLWCCLAAALMCKVAPASPGLVWLVQGETRARQTAIAWT